MGLPLSVVGRSPIAILSPFYANKSTKFPNTPRNTASCWVDAVKRDSDRDVEFLARAVTKTREKASTTAINKAGKFA
jgi:hypothetical protein